MEEGDTWAQGSPPASRRSLLRWRSLNRSLSSSEPLLLCTPIRHGGAEHRFSTSAVHKAKSLAQQLFCKKSRHGISIVSYRACILYFGLSPTLHKRHVSDVLEGETRPKTVSINIKGAQADVPANRERRLCAVPANQERRLCAVPANRERRLCAGVCIML